MEPCRICLAGAPEKHVNQLKSSKKDGEKSGAEILLFCLDIQVTEDCSLTKRLCTKCFKKILTFFKFKSMALKNEVYLKSFIHKTSIKEEFDEETEVLSLEEQLNHSEKDSLEDSMNADTFNDIEYLEECVFSVSEDIEIEYAQDAGETSGVGKLESDDDAINGSKVLEQSPNADSNHDTETTETPRLCLTDNTSKSEAKNTPQYCKTTALCDDSNKTQNNTNIKEEPKMAVVQAKAGVCDQCGAHVKNMKLHVLVHVPKEKRQKFPCRECSKAFMTPSALYTHRIKKHSNTSQLGHCDLCDKDFVCLKTHQLVMHERDKLPLQCGVCEKRFAHQSVLDAHMTLHTKERAFQCDNCGKNFRLKILLNQHIRSVHEKVKNFACQYCSKTFFKKYHFTNHMRTHTKEKPYKCKLCQTSCTTSSALQYHYKYNHSNETGDVKQFHCQICTKSFARANTLYMHMRMHRQEKPYSCRHCDAKYARTFDRNRHERNHHGKHALKDKDPLIS